MRTVFKGYFSKLNECCWLSWRVNLVVCKICHKNCMLFLTQHIFFVPKVIWFKTRRTAFLNFYIVVLQQARVSKNNPWNMPYVKRYIPNI